MFDPMHLEPLEYIPRGNHVVVPGRISGEGPQGVVLAFVQLDLGPEPEPYLAESRAALFRFGVTREKIEDQLPSRH